MPSIIMLSLFMEDRERRLYWAKLKVWCRFLKRRCGFDFGSPEMRRGLEDWREGWESALKGRR